MYLILSQGVLIMSDGQGFTNVDGINFGYVSQEIKGCGFRHEEFPDIRIEKADRVIFLALTKQRDYLRNAVFEIPENLSGKTLEAYLRGVISLKMETSNAMDNWWENLSQRYEIPWGLKYNPQQNVFYRHIDDNNRVSTMDRNPNRPRDNQNRQRDQGNNQGERNFNQGNNQQLQQNSNQQ
jgi:hypothetical protein